MTRYAYPCVGGPLDSKHAMTDASQVTIVRTITPTKGNDHTMLALLIIILVCIALLFSIEAAATIGLIVLLLPLALILLFGIIAGIIAVFSR